MVVGWGGGGVIINRFSYILPSGVGHFFDYSSDSSGVSFRVADLARSVIPSFRKLVGTPDVRHKEPP